MYVNSNEYILIPLPKMTRRYSDRDNLPKITQCFERIFLPVRYEQVVTPFLIKIRSNITLCLRDHVTLITLFVWT